MVRNRHKALKRGIRAEERTARWMAFQKATEKGTEEIIPAKDGRNRKPWITEEILTLMDERREYKDKDE